MRKFVYRNNYDKKTFLIEEDGVINKMEFCLDGVNFEAEAGRYYMLEMSRCLRADCDGKLVRRRISKKVFEELFEKACEKVGVNMDENKEENNMTAELVLENLKALVGKEIESYEIIAAFGDFEEGGESEVIVEKSSNAGYDYVAYIKAVDSTMFYIDVDADDCIINVWM